MSGCSTGKERPSCPFCDAEIAEAAFPFCSACEVKLATCPKCHKPVSPEAKVCAACGAKIPRASKQK